MKYRLNFLMYHKCRSILLQETRRYAGHSKWQNIKHTKQEQDAARASLFRSLTNKMRIAISESGSAEPSQNIKLAQLIDQAKKANMPVSTLNTFLQKMKNPASKSQSDIMTVRGPGGCTLILYISASNIKTVKPQIAYQLKKNSAQIVDSSVMNIFDCACYVIASKTCDLDQAMEDAIHINAQDVEEVKEDDQICFKFKCDFQSSQKSTNQLINLGYSVISSDDVCTPETLVELGEEDLKVANRLKERLSAFDEIDKIDDNIAE